MPADRLKTSDEWQAWLDSGGPPLESEDAKEVVAELLWLRQQHGVWFDCDRPPDVIYHYCSSEAFASIVENKEMWLFDSAASNDATEETLAVKTIERLVREIIEPTEVSGILDWFRVTRGRQFITCFSELGDSLGQWRGYAQNGTGFALGINPNLLRCKIGLPLLDFKPAADRSVVNVSRQASLLRMIYDHQVFEESVRATCERQNRGLKSATDKTEKANASAGMVSLLHSLSLCAKHRGFREEREWRLLPPLNLQVDEVPTVEPALTRLRGQHTVPHNTRFIGGASRAFQRFSLEDSPGNSSIVSVVQGPCNKISEQELRYFLTRHGLGAVPVLPADVPLR